jgi:hypothetical protein
MLHEGPSLNADSACGRTQVLVPLLVALAAPAPAQLAPAVPLPLRDVAVRLITSLPASPAGAAFRSQLAAQPTADKLRLQAALRGATGSSSGASAAGSGSPAGAPPAVAGAALGAALPGGAVATTGGAAGGGPARKPAIQLKTTFVLPQPKK